MSLGDCELTYTDKTVHLAAVLVSEESGGLAESHRESSVRALTVEEYLILERTGHGAHCEAFLGVIVRVSYYEHTVEIVIPVTGNFV